MSRVQVAVAAMKQKDTSLSKKMNVNTDLVIANQGNVYSYIRENNNGNTITMMTTATRGVGLNRNFALQQVSDDIILLADDDIVYKDNYAQLIEAAFDEIPDADVIVFRMQFVKNGEVYEVDTHKTKRLHFFNGLSFGTYQIAIKRSSLLRANIHFTELFGGGCIYSSGEDSMFLIDCFRKGLKLYSHKYLIGDNIRNSSSWFTGFHEKFFYDRGAFIACAFPKIKTLILLYYLYIYRNSGELSWKKKKQMMKAGIAGFSKLISYDQYMEK